VAFPISLQRPRCWPLLFSLWTVTNSFMYYKLSNSNCCELELNWNWTGCN
jgi:hypothetical protein